jgi:hypothetical protein
MGVIGLWGSIVYWKYIIVFVLLFFLFFFPPKGKFCLGFEKLKDWYWEKGGRFYCVLYNWLFLVHGEQTGFSGLV